MEVYGRCMVSKNKHLQREKGMKALRSLCKHAQYVVVMIGNDCIHQGRDLVLGTNERDAFIYASYKRHFRAMKGVCVGAMHAA